MKNNEIDFYALINKSSGLFNGYLSVLPNNFFSPKELKAYSLFANHQKIIGLNSFDTLTASSIGFNDKDAITSCFGEAMERYCACIPKETLYYGSFRDFLKNKKEIVAPNIFNFVRKEHLKREVNEETELFWIEAKDLINGKKVLIPEQIGCFCNHSNERFFLSTSTGMASGKTYKDALTSGFLECVERHAFSQFWYLQKELPIIKYDKNTILKEFINNEKINILYNNQFINIVVFDLTDLAKIPTYLTVFEYKYKEKLEFSIGCASRLTREEALIKSGLEAYQGIGYGDMLLRRYKKLKVPLKKLDKKKVLNDFRMHYWYYNAYPSERNGIVIFDELNNNNFFNRIKKQEREYNNIEEVIKGLNIDKCYVVDLTQNQIKKIGFHVVKVVVPKLILLSGDYGTPLLNYKEFDNKELFLEKPHFFP